MQASAESLPFDGQEFDVVCCCDVLEHVDDLELVVAEISRVLKPGGVFLFDTINRTITSKLVAIKLAQDWWPTRLIPRDVHVWEKFIRPAELMKFLERHGLPNCELAGLSPTMSVVAIAALAQKKLGRISFAELGSKLKLRQSANLSIAYMGFAVRSLRA